jgi:hypothetical protein
VHLQDDAFQALNVVAFHDGLWSLLSVVDASGFSGFVVGMGNIVIVTFKWLEVTAVSDATLPPDLRAISVSMRGRKMQFALAAPPLTYFTRSNRKASNCI